MVIVRSSLLGCERGLNERVVTPNGRPAYLRKFMSSLALSAIEAVLEAGLIDIEGRGERQKSSGWLVVVDRNERHPIAHARVAIVCGVLCVEVARVARPHKIEI
jgi:hypothetical protein